MQQRDESHTINIDYSEKSQTLFGGTDWDAYNSAEIISTEWTPLWSSLTFILPFCIHWACSQGLFTHGFLTMPLFSHFTFLCLYNWSVIHIHSFWLWILFIWSPYLGICLSTIFRMMLKCIQLVLLCVYWIIWFVDGKGIDILEKRHDYRPIAPREEDVVCDSVWKLRSELYYISHST